MKFTLLAMPTLLLVTCACVLSAHPSPRSTPAHVERDARLTELCRQSHTLHATLEDLEASTPPSAPRGIGQ